jgi:hypothetical protein
VNTKESRTSAVIVELRQGKTTAELQRLSNILPRLQIRDGLPLQQMRGVIALRPKGLS